MTRLQAGLSSLRRYLIAACLVAAAAGIRLTLLGVLGMRAPYITFFPAVTIAAAIGGLGPGLAATALSAVLARRFWIEGGGHGWIQDRGDWAGISIFLVSGALISIVCEIKNRAQARARALELKNAEADQRKLIELLPDALFVNRDNKVVFLNRAALELFGADDRSQILGKSPFDLFPPHYHEGMRERIRRLRLGETVELIEEQIVRLDGSLRDVEVTARPFVDLEGPAIQVVLRDITARKLMERTLAQRQALLDAVFEWTADPIYVKDRECRMLLANPATLRVIGREASEVLGRSDAQFLSDPALGGKVVETDLEVMEAGQTRSVEERIPTASGDRIFLSTKTPWHDADGHVIGLVGVSRDITERKEMEAEVMAARLAADGAREAAESANRAKDQFLAVLSHELRTPLTPVLATVTMLQDEGLLPPELIETMDMVRRNIELEARLIDDLLDVTRIARGKLELDRQPADLRMLIQRAVEVCRPDIEARQLHFGVTFREELFPVMADPARLQQVFWNLLKNAIKFTPVGGCVGIHCERRDARHAVIEFSDSGVGIAPDKLARIFDAFEQGERTRTRRFGGLGLGLTISRAMIDMHGGSIEAQSDGVNRGSLFRVTLPLCEPVAVTSGDSPSAADATAAGDVSRRILIVEDHGDTARILSRALKLSGYEVRSAADVATALEIAAQWRFDLLLSDLGLPDRSGLDLIREVRVLRPDVPAIALSGYGTEEDLAGSRAAGFDEHLIKPIDLRTLREHVAGILRRAPERAVSDG